MSQTFYRVINKTVVEELDEPQFLDWLKKTFPTAEQRLQVINGMEMKVTRQNPNGFGKAITTYTVQKYEV